MDRATATRDLAEDQVRVKAGPVTLEGNLGIPERARGVVLFAHGSGSGRHSPRNRFVAGQLREAGLATLLVDLLTEDEEAVDQYTAHLRFDIGLLDLAGDCLQSVRAPTLLIVGGDDEPVIGLNEGALARLAAPVKKLVIVPGATHLFEEPGKLDEVSRLAAEWFTRHLGRAAGVRAD